MMSRLRRWPEILLVLIYYTLRLHNLLALPGFFDEAIHLRWAKLVWAGQWALAAADGRLINVWAYALFYPFEAGLWIARNVEVLLATLGFAALLAAGRQLLSRRAALIAGALYAVIPFAFFYERMALVDPFAAPLVSLTLLASTSLLPCQPDRQAARGWTLIAGLALAGLLLTKLTNLLFAPLPLLAALILSPPETRRRAVREAGLIYLIAALPVGLIVGALRFLAHSDLGFALVNARTAPAPLLERLSANAAGLYDFARFYLGYPVMIAIAVGFITTIISRHRARWLALGLTAIPMSALLLGTNVIESRFVVPLLPLLLLIAGAGAAEVLALIPAVTKKSATNFTYHSSNSCNAWQIRLAVWLAGVSLVLASGPARFIWLAWHQPGDLPLTEIDRFEYVEEWPAGFGIREAAAMIFGPGAERPLDVVVGDEGLIPQLSLYAGAEPGLAALYAFDAGGVRLLHLVPEFPNPFAGVADPTRRVLYVVEVPSHQSTLDALIADRTLLARFPRPTGKSVIEVYQLTARRPAPPSIAQNSSSTTSDPQTP